MRSWFQSFPEVPSQHPTVELKAGCREQFKLHSHSEDTESLPEDITSLSDSASSLDWPGSLTPPQFKVCFWSRPALFQISGVDSTPLAIERRIHDKSHPTQSCGKTHHSSSGQLAACFFPLWTKMLPGPDFWHCLSSSQSWYCCLYTALYLPKEATIVNYQLSSVVLPQRPPNYMPR